MSDYICGVCGLPIDFAAGERFVPQPISGYRHVGDYCVKRLAADNARLAGELAEARAEQSDAERDALQAQVAGLTTKRDRYYEALIAIEHVGPLGVDTYPKCYELIQDIARAALAGPTRTPDQPDAALPIPDFLRRGKD